MHMLLFQHIQHAFKTGLACLASLWISYMLGSPYGLWAVVSSIIAMQGRSVADSIQASLLRFSGMGAGAVVGLLLLLIVPKEPITMGVVTFLITTLCAYWTRHGAFFMLASIAACIVVLAGSIQTTTIPPLVFAITLVWEVTLGVVVAMIVSILLWPLKLADRLRADVTVQFERCAELLDMVVNAYLDGQQHLSDNMIVALNLQTWGNHERITKVRRLEYHIFHDEHRGLALQVLTIDRCVEALRSLLDALNEYDEDSADPLLGPELRDLADYIMNALEHMGGPDAFKPSPQIVRNLTEGVVNAENRLTELRAEDELRKLSLHRLMQLFAIYQSMRQLSEELLINLDTMQSLNIAERTKKKNRFRQIFG